MDQQQQSRRRPSRRQLLWTGGVVGLLLLTVAILIGYRYGITLWNWIKLLLVPAVIAGGGLWFNRQQRERELEMADRRAQDEALQAYLAEIGKLLLDKDRPLLQTDEPDEVRMLARARTLTVLRRLDGERKASVVQFLWESALLHGDREVGRTTAAVDLQRADLSEVNLSGALLYSADLSRTNLSRANLSEANLQGSNLSGANLSGADLSKSYLVGTRLRAANLSYANLSGAEGIIIRALEQQAETLKEATMPNGQKYEDWLKEREGRKEDRENDGSS